MATCLIWQVLTNEAKRRQYDSGASSLSELLGGFWQQLTQRMQGKPTTSGGGTSIASAGRVAASATGAAPIAIIAAGSGLALEELAAAEEEDSGIQAPMLLSAFEDECELPPNEEAPEGEAPEDAPTALDSDGGEQKPGVKYDYWGRPMA